jgi:hypothetical protein
MFCGDPERNSFRLISSAALMSELQKEFASKDRFLIIYYSLETTFGFPEGSSEGSPEVSPEGNHFISINRHI